MKRSTLNGAVRKPPRTDKYSAMVGSLLDINRQIGVGTDSTELNNEVAGLTALGDLKETLSQERALLYSVTANG